MSIMMWILSGAAVLITAYGVASAVMIKKLTGKSLVVQAPPASEVRIARDMPYSYTGKRPLTFDLFLPARENGKFATVVLFHGDGPDLILRTAKDWKLFQDYGRLLSSRGLAVAAFNHRRSFMGKKPEAAQKDLTDLVDLLRAKSDVYNLDPENFTIWAFSAGAAAALSVMIRQRPAWLRALVSYYGLLDAPDSENSPVSLILERGLPVPLFAVGAARDASALIRESFVNLYDVSQSGRADIQCRIHSSGRHGFDALDDNEESKRIIEETITFVCGRAGVVRPADSKTSRVHSSMEETK